MGNNQSVVRKKSETHAVNGVELEFYPVAPLMLSLFLLQFKAVFAISKRLFTPAPRLGREQYESDKGKGTTFTVLDPVDPKAHASYLALVEQDTNRLVEMVTEEKCRVAIGRLILDSLRSDANKLLVDKEGNAVELKRDDASAKILMGHDDLDVPTLFGLLEGMWKANTGRFGPFVQRVRGALVLKMKTLLSEAGKLPVEETETTPETPTSTPDSTTPST
jgi:hypothetical protein